MKIIKSLQIVMLSTIALGFQSSGHAQVNLVNLYDWTFTYNVQTGFTLDEAPSVPIESSTSARIDDGAMTGNTITVGVPTSLTGNLNTTPGATYEITYTMQSVGLFPIYGSMSFGDFDSGATDLELPDDSTPPFNFDFTTVATSTTTTMSFETTAIDYQNAMDLSNVSVIEVPEISAARLFGLGGCVLILARQWRRLFQRRKRN